jgi:formylglycine-generating enzyme required for sulfatase activity
VALIALFAALLGACGEKGGSTTTRTSGVLRTKGGVEMVLLPGGAFEMGSDTKEEVDEPRHRVCVSSFYMDRQEVTQEEYERLVGKNPSMWKEKRNPVEQIRWTQAAAYCNARSREEGLRPAYDLATLECDFTADGYRLPTEAEWEYACRAGTKTAYPFGNDPARLGLHAWFKENALRSPQPVAQKLPNPWGLYDMHGNVWEWCNDFYQEDSYRRSPEKDPRGPEKGETRVLRGGSWNSRASQCRSSYRDQEYPDFKDVCFAADRHGFIGFRCVRSCRASEKPASPEAAQSR